MALPSTRILLREMRQTYTYTYLLTYHTPPSLFTFRRRLSLVMEWNSPFFSLEKYVSGIHILSHIWSCNLIVCTVRLFCGSNLNLWSVHDCRKYILNEKSWRGKLWYIKNSLSDIFWIRNPATQPVLLRIAPCRKAIQVYKVKLRFWYAVKLTLPHLNGHWRAAYQNTDTTQRS